MEDKKKKLPRGKPWQPGQSGNPRGRPPKDVCLTSLLKEALDQVPEGSKDGKTWAEKIVFAWLLFSAMGNPTLMKELLDRVEGKVVDRVEAEVTASLSLTPDQIAQVTEAAEKEFTEGLQDGDTDTG